MAEITMSFEGIAHALDTEGSLIATVGGVTWLVGFDEDCTGIGGWPVGAPDREPAHLWFGSEIDEAAAQIEAWAGAGTTTQETDHE
jgi:hypothetical protein